MIYTTTIIAVLPVLLAAVLFAGVLFAHAATSVTNDVSVSANSGGNTGGTVTNGGASVNVDIVQSVNGVAQPPIHIATTSASGSVSAEVHTEISGSGSTTLATSSAAIRFGGAASATPPAVSLPHPLPRPAAPSPAHMTATEPFAPSATAAYAATASLPRDAGPPGVLGRFGSFFLNLFNWIFGLK